MVPLSNAWKSGAADWTTEQRKTFANDLVNPQLIAVTDNVCFLNFFSCCWPLVMCSIYNIVSVIYVFVR